MTENGEQTQQHTPSDVGAQKLARVYAESFLNAADNKGATQDCVEELQSLIHDVFPRQPTIEHSLSSRAVPRDRKEALIRSTFQDRANETFTNFLLVLNRHDRLDLLPAIEQAVRALWNERTNQVPVEVTSAMPLEEGQLEALKTQLRAKFGKEPLIESRIDADLLGGLTVKVGDWFYDSSVRTRIERIKQQLIECSSHEIQSGRDRFSSDQ